jgi:5'-methylthioadenosine phosphorylase
MTNEKVAIAIIGGTGVYDPGLFTDAKRIKVYTPFGAPSDLITIGNYCGIKVAFLPRHGRDHHLPPHKVPYRANIWALKQLGVQHIIAPCAVGSLRQEIPPGQIVFPDQFVDFTKNRDYTFYDEGEVIHVAVHEPFCSELRVLAVDAAKKQDINFQDKGTIITIQGPRYSTKAESIYFRDAVKADIIGMTLVPECQLARELEICYLSIAAVTDYDSWSKEPVVASMVLKTMENNLGIIRKLLIELLPKISSLNRDNCSCAHALKDAGH